MSENRGNRPEHWDSSTNTTAAKAVGTYPGGSCPTTGLLRPAADSRADARATPVPSRRGPRPALGPGKAPVDRRGGDDRCAAVRWAARRADVGAPPAGFARGGPASQGLTPEWRGGPMERTGSLPILTVAGSEYS